MRAASKFSEEYPAKKDAKSGGPGRASPNLETASMAAYIADMAAEMSSLAERSGLQMLAQFLSLARVEAEIRSHEYGGYNTTRRSLATEVPHSKTRSRRRKVTR